MRSLKTSKKVTGNGIGSRGSDSITSTRGPGKPALSVAEAREMEKQEVSIVKRLIQAFLFPVENIRERIRRGGAGGGRGSCLGRPLGFRKK